MAVMSRCSKSSGVTLIRTRGPVRSWRWATPCRMRNAPACPLWNITVCDTCLETGMLDKNLPALWEKNIAALRWEMDDQNRVTMGVRELSDKGRKAVADSILELVDSPPLGVLGVESWEAIMERERG